MVLKTLFLLLAVTPTVVHRADATSSTTWLGGCGEETLAVCSDDPVCTECVDTAKFSNEEFSECTANYEWSGICGLHSGGSCCAIEVSGVDCLANDNWVAYSECLIEGISNGECTSVTCSGSTATTADDVSAEDASAEDASAEDASAEDASADDASANDASGAGRGASRLNTVSSTAAGAAAGVATAAFCMGPALWV